MARKRRVSMVLRHRRTPEPASLPASDATLREWEAFGAPLAEMIAAMQRAMDAAASAWVIRARDRDLADVVERDRRRAVFQAAEGRWVVPAEASADGEAGHADGR